MTTPNTAQEPTPWTDARAVRFNGLECYGNPDGDITASADTRTLERHLRRIVEAKSTLDKAEQGLRLVPHPNPSHDDMWAAVRELDAAIQAAKEELSK